MFSGFSGWAAAAKQGGQQPDAAARAGCPAACADFALTGRQQGRPCSEYVTAAAAPDGLVSAPACHMARSPLRPSLQCAPYGPAPARRAGLSAARCHRRRRRRCQQHRCWRLCIDVAAVSVLMCGPRPGAAGPGTGNAGGREPACGTCRCGLQVRLQGDDVASVRIGSSGQRALWRTTRLKSRHGPCWAERSTGAVQSPFARCSGHHHLHTFSRRSLAQRSHASSPCAHVKGSRTRMAAGGPLAGFVYSLPTQNTSALCSTR